MNPYNHKMEHTYSQTRSSVDVVTIAMIWRQHRDNIEDDIGLIHYIDGLVQDRSISITNALEKLQSSTKPSLCNVFIILITPD